MISKNKIKNNLISTLIIFVFIIFIISFAFSAETATIDEQLEQLKSILDSSSNYSAFQTTMLLKSTQQLLDTGISFEDTKEIIENSVEESLDAYSMKKVFDVILDTQQDGLPTEPLINKINEGFAKNVDKTIIILVISAKAENLRKAAEILDEARQEGLEINGGEEMLKILADSLENDVPDESLSWLVKTGTTEGKSILEISEISEELSYLSLMAADSGLSTEEIALLFQKAIESSSNIEEICENIQNSLETQISTAKIERVETGQPSGPSTSTEVTTEPASEAGSVSVGETPSQEAGEAPTETGDTPTTPTSPEEEMPPPPPEN
jgi:hypothetical protein